MKGAAGNQGCPQTGQGPGEALILYRSGSKFLAQLLETQAQPTSCLCAKSKVVLGRT